MRDHSTRRHNMNSGRPQKNAGDYISRHPSLAKRAGYHRDQARERARLRYSSRRVWFDAIKAQLGCQICGEREPVTLDLHHLDHSEKEMGFSGNLTSSISKIYSEMGKCAVVCSNCHRKIHYSIIDDRGLVPIDTSALPHPKSFADNSTCAQSELPLFQGVSESETEVNSDFGTIQMPKTVEPTLT